jgi:transcription factor C subunit 6
VTWRSPIDLIAGCGDGKIAIWDVSKHVQEHIEFTRYQNQNEDQTEDGVQQNLANPSPYFIYHLHDSYILAAHACLPYYQHLLITASIDGFYRLCDLRNPDFDTVESHRYRLHPSTFEYCPYLNTAIAPDGFDAVHFLSLRRFFTEQELGWCDGRILTMGCGRAHSCLLLGSADGSVLAMNVVPRIVKERSNPQKYEVIWFKHEWRPETESDSIFGEKTPTRVGISRITEAFAPRLKSSKKHQDNKRTAARDSGARTWETIHEEPTAITQLEWNPVPRCGGWAAAGMGSGLLRVEDLAVSP